MYSVWTCEEIRPRRGDRQISGSGLCGPSSRSTRVSRSQPVTSATDARARTGLPRVRAVVHETYVNASASSITRPKALKRIAAPKSPWMRLYTIRVLPQPGQLTLNSALVGQTGMTPPGVVGSLQEMKAHSAIAVNATAAGAFSAASRDMSSFSVSPQFGVIAVRCLAANQCRRSASAVTGNSIRQGRRQKGSTEQRRQHLRRLTTRRTSWHRQLIFAQRPN